MSQSKIRLIVIIGNLNALRYVHKVLDTEAIKFFCEGTGLVHCSKIMHAPIGTAALTAIILAANNICILDWHALSHDMNPIKKIWDALGRQEGKTIKRTHQTL